MVVVGSGELTSLGTVGTTQLTDKVDSPHTGLFKALHNMTQGNVALDFGGTDDQGNFGFSHVYTYSSGVPSVTVQGGVILFEGKKVAVADSSTLTLTKPSSGAFYHWITVNSGGTIGKTLGTTDGVVPEIPVQTVPISLIKVQSTDSSGDLATQFYTTTKQSTSLSIGYDNSEEYTEVSSFTGTSAGLFISNIGTATVVGADKILIQDVDASNVIKTVTASSIASVLGTPAVLTGTTNNTITTVTAANAIQGEANLLFDGSTLAVTGALTTTTTATVGTDLTVTGGDITYGNAQNATLGITATAHDTAGKPLSISSGPTTAGTTNNIAGGSLTFKGGQGKGSGNGGNIIFQTAKASGSGSSLNALATALTISGVGDFSTFDGLVGIGTSSSTPSAPLHIIYTGAAEGLIIESTDGGSANAPDLILFRNSGSPADDDELGVINFRGDDGAGNSTDYAFIAARTTEVDNGSEEGALKFGIFDAGSSSTMARLAKPNVETNATVHAGWHTRATVASVAGATYSPDIACSGIVILMTNGSSIVTLPDVAAADVGVQFTCINTSGGTLTGKIVSADTSNTRFNGAGSYAAQDITDDQALTFLCTGADNWQIIG
jgi:hypothetical protein